MCGDVFVCVCACICVYKHIYVCVCMCIFMCTCVSVNVYLYMCVCCCHLSSHSCILHTGNIVSILLEQEDGQRFVLSNLLLIK